jgi:hypothetical protein
MAQVKENLKQSKMDAEFKKDARKYKDVSVHQFNVKAPSTPGLPPQLAQFLSSIQADFAMVGNYMVVSMGGGTSLDGLIDNVQAKKSATPTALAATKMGPGGKTYLDINVASLLKFGFDLAGPEVANTPFAGMPAALEGVPPITSAVFTDPTTATGKFVIPAELFAKLGAEIQKASKAQNGAPLPGGPAPVAPRPPVVPAPGK